MARILSELITYLLYKTPGWEQTLSVFLPFGLALVRRAFWRVKGKNRQQKQHAEEHAEQHSRVYVLVQ
jgi:hypothetical protein